MKDKKKIRTFKQQLFYAIDNRNCPGRSKHQDKLSGAIESHDRIYSSGAKGEYARLKNVASMLYNFLLENYPDYNHKPLSEVPTTLFKEFYESRVNTCTQKTLDGYRNSIIKITRVCNTVYNLNLNWGDITVPASKSSSEKIRTVRIDKKVCWEAINYLKKDSNGYKGCLISFMSGARAEEITLLEKRDIDINNKVVHIRPGIGKGGRPREIPIADNQVKYYYSMIKNLNTNDRIVAILPDSINKAFNRALEAYDLIHKTNYALEMKKHKTGLHAIRKTFATETYNQKVEIENKELLLSKLKALKSLL